MKNQIDQMEPAIEKLYAVKNYSGSNFADHFGHFRKKKKGSKNIFWWNRQIFHAFSQNRYRARHDWTGRKKKFKSAIENNFGFNKNS
jgi:hypothetical protein